MLKVRYYTDKDRSYVISTWLHSYWKFAGTPATVSRARFDRDLDTAIKLSLTNGMMVKVAFDDDAPEVIIGWIAFGPGAVIHYVFVRSAFRKNGVAETLLDSFPFSQTDDLYHSLVTHDYLKWQPFDPMSSYAPNAFPVRSAAPSQRPRNPNAFPVRKT